MAYTLTGSPRDVLYDNPFFEDSTLVRLLREISSNHHISTNKLGKCSDLQAKLGSEVFFPGSATFISEQNDTALGLQRLELEKKMLQQSRVSTLPMLQDRLRFLHSSEAGSAPCNLRESR